MTTTYDTDPAAPTEASAWASSPLGTIDGPDTPRRYDWPATDAPDDDEPDPAARRAGLMMLAACGVALGAALGVTLFGYVDVTPAVAPGSIPAPTPAVTRVMISDVPPAPVQP